MFALRSGKGSRKGAGRSAGARATPALDGLVLPRSLRKPARIIGRFIGGHITPPRYAATIATAAFLSITGLYGTVLGGHVPTIVQAVTARSGFAIDDVRMAGNKETSDIDILERLGLDGWTSLIGMDADAARLRISDLPWVESVSVRKIYPNTIEISVVERKPFAIWQHGRALSLIDAKGSIIVPFRQERYATLPLVIGPGANAEAAAFVARLEETPELSSRVKAFIRVAERRWDLRLENGLTIKLPETGEDDAIAEIVSLDREQGLLSRDLAAVDMRFEDRLVVKLTPEAVLRRNAALNERDKKSGRPEKKT